MFWPQNDINRFSSRSTKSHFLFIFSFPERSYVQANESCLSILMFRPKLAITNLFHAKLAVERDEKCVENGFSSVHLKQQHQKMKFHCLFHSIFFLSGPDGIWLISFLSPPNLKDSYRKGREHQNFHFREMEIYSLIFKKLARAGDEDLLLFLCSHCAN